MISPRSDMSQNEQRLREAEEKLWSLLKKLRLAKKALAKSEDNVKKIRDRVYLSTLILSEMLATTIDMQGDDYQIVHLADGTIAVTAVSPEAR